MDHVGRRGRPPLVVGIVLALHALLLFALLRVTVLRPAESDDGDTSILLLDASDFAVREPSPPVPPAIEDVSVPADTAAPPPRARVTPASATDAPSAVAASGGAVSGSATATTPPGRVDWYRVGETVARERVERAAAAARPARAPFRKAKEGPRTTIFDSGKRRRTGTSEKLADGESIFWINENCYITTDSDSLLQKDLHDAHRGMTRCMIPLGKRQARGDLFDKLPNHVRKVWPGDPTLPDSRGGTGPGGVPEPIPEPVPNSELEIIEPEASGR